MTENRFPICRAVLVSHKTCAVIAWSFFFFSSSSSELICLLQERLTGLERRGSLVSLCACVQYLHFPHFIWALRTLQETEIILIRSTGPALLLLWHYQLWEGKPECRKCEPWFWGGFACSLPGGHKEGHVCLQGTQKYCLGLNPGMRWQCVRELGTAASGEVSKEGPWTSNHLGEWRVNFGCRKGATELWRKLISSPVTFIHGWNLIFPPCL